MTNFQSETNRSTAAWLTPERAVVVVPIMAGLALAAALATAVITPQVVQLRERRLVVDGHHGVEVHGSGTDFRREKVDERRAEEPTESCVVPRIPLKVGGMPRACVVRRDDEEVSHQGV